jgi:hypothetical protein
MKLKLREQEVEVPDSIGKRVLARGSELVAMRVDDGDFSDDPLWTYRFSVPLEWEVAE